MADREKLEAALEAARETVASLTQKRESAERELQRLEAAKRPLILPGLSGDRTQGRRLKEINTRVLEQKQTLEDYETAIRQARQQVEVIERITRESHPAERLPWSGAPSTSPCSPSRTSNRCH